jgi:flagellar biogenesis protein FliO
MSIAPNAQTLAASGLAALPLRRDAAGDPSMVSAWIFLGVLVVAAAAAVWFGRRRKASAGAPPTLQRIESLALTSHASLHVVRWGDEELLMGCAQAGIEVVSRRPAHPPAREGMPS